MVAAHRVLVENQPVELVIAEMARHQGFWLNDDAAYLRRYVGGPSPAHVGLGGLGGIVGGSSE
jgi:hypothetical protein